MCSLEEAERRQRTGRISRFEESTPGSYDPSKVIKEYFRGPTSDIRPPPTLTKTLTYLFTHILNGSDFIPRFEFISDRCRAIEKDYKIAGKIREGVGDLEKIARFHILAAGEGRKYPEFQTELNWKRLEDVLGLIIEIYSEEISPNQGEFMSYWLLFNLNRPLSVGIILKNATKVVWNDGLFQLAFELTRSYYQNNYVRMERLTAAAPCLVAVLVSAHVRRSDLTSMLSGAYRGLLPAYDHFMVISVPTDRLNVVQGVF